MTQPVYSTQVFLGTLPAAWATIYTVPAGMVLSIKDISLHGSATPTRAQIGVAKGSGAGSTIVVDIADLGDTVAVWTGTVVLNPTDEVVATSSGTAATAVISGFLLTQPTP